MRQDDMGILLHAAAAFPRPVAKSLHPWQGHAFSTKTGKLGWQPEYHREIEDQPKGEEPSEDEVNSDFLAFFVGNEGGKEAKAHEPAVDPAPSQESASTEPPLAPKPKSPVTITKDGNVWVATWPKDLPKDKWWALKDLVKAAGFKPDTTKGYFRWVTKDPALAAKFQDSEDAEALVAKHNEEQLAKQAKDAEAIASSKATDANIEPPAPQGLKFLPYQKAGIAYGLDHKHVLIADEMGLGKTIQAIGIANTDPEANKILIVCPASLKLNWKKEWEKWDVKGLKVGVADGKTWPEDADVVILNYDIAGKLAAKVHAQKWDMMIVDESHYLKNQTAQRTKTILGSKGKKGAPDTPGFKAERRVFLTGTPIVNRPKELWSLVESLDPNGLGQNFFGFMKKYTNATHNGYGWDFSGAANLPDLQAKLRSSFMVRRLKKDVLKELPPKIRSVVTLEPTGDQIKIVKAEQMAAEAMDAKILKLKADVELAKAQSDEQYAEAVKNLKEGAALAFTDMAKARKDVAVAKIPSVIEKAKDLLEETDKIVIMAHHHEVIDALKAEFGEDAVRLDGRMDTKSRDESVVAFQNDPKVKVFIGSIKAAGVGITLTAAHTVLFAELDWVPGNVSQAEDRCHRIGQKDVVDVHHVVLDGTMDSRMANTLVAKQNVIDHALDLGDVKPDDPKLLNAEALKATSIVESDLDLIAPTKDSPATAGITRAQVEEQAKAMEPAQVEAIHQALMVLAGLDSDHAMEKNDVGFNGLDSYIGHSLAKSWELSPKQAVLGAKILAKYHKQIDAETYTLATGKQHPSMGKAKKTKGDA